MSRKSCTLFVMTACVILGAFLNALLRAMKHLRIGRRSRRRTRKRTWRWPRRDSRKLRVKTKPSMVRCRVECWLNFRRDCSSRNSACGRSIATRPATHSRRRLRLQRTRSARSKRIMRNRSRRTEFRRTPCRQRSCGGSRRKLRWPRARVAALKAIGREPAGVQVRWEIGQLQDQVRALWARPLIED